MASFKRESATSLINVPEKVFIDTSVWLYTNGPQADPANNKSAIYSELLGKLIASNCKIYINQLVLSEFFNVVVKYFLKMHKKNMQIKAYKKTEDYRKNIQNMFAYLISVTKTPNLILIEYSDLDKYVEFVSEALDFNDMVYAKICMDMGLALITDDEDFSDTDCDIISDNYNLTSSVASL
ncbi:PIN domain-containing protein [Deinococcus taeanensis]|uniref:type II toxin-antitoxin system VapC family toxin n=1 Tax=Deinococcus taeanensis TaxID=2737050 RepID=UPI001CDC84D2|nr:PIN domain-containing protein [Deinococcus taeanensis]UBV43256.1 PIN domain-containing protein [Deinococcus taeanensis]